MATKVPFCFQLNKLFKFNLQVSILNICKYTKWNICKRLLEMQNLKKNRYSVEKTALLCGSYRKKYRYLQP